MIYPKSRTGLFIRASKVDDTYVPTSYVVVDFGGDLSAEESISEDRDMTNVLGYRRPLDFIAVDFELIYETKHGDRISATRSRVARDLLSQFDGLEECAPSCVPTEIAMQQNNRPAVAMYMLAYQYKSYEEIAESFNVEVETVRRYRRRVRSASD